MEGRVEEADVVRGEGGRRKAESIQVELWPFHPNLREKKTKFSREEGRGHSKELVFLTCGVHEKYLPRTAVAKPPTCW